MDLKPQTEYSASIVRSCNVACGANRAQIGMNPRHRDNTPSALTVFTKQSIKEEYIFWSVGWFIKRVRRLSAGLTVNVMKNPATKAAEKDVRKSLRDQPVTSVM